MLFLVLFACGGTPECGPAECAAVCADAAPEPTPAAAPTPTPAAGLSAFEKGLIDPVLADLRAGVRAWEPDSVGICPKSPGRTCSEALGLNPGELPPGDYIVHAALRVPRLGAEEWTVHYEQSCTTTRESDNGTSTTTNDYDKHYDVTYKGEELPATLSPLMRITSPNKGGRKDCTFRIVAPHPDGDKVIEGGWAVPDAG